jgi:hypothetical protein
MRRSGRAQSCAHHWHWPSMNVRRLRPRVMLPNGLCTIISPLGPGIKLFRIYSWGSCPPFTTQRLEWAAGRPPRLFLPYKRALRSHSERGTAPRGGAGAVLSHQLRDRHPLFSSATRCVRDNGGVRDGARETASYATRCRNFPFSA